MITSWEEDGRSATGVDRKGLKNIRLPSEVKLGRRYIFVLAKSTVACLHSTYQIKKFQVYPQLPMIYGCVCVCV